MKKVQLQISEANARLLYRKLPEFRPALEDSLGRKYFEKKVTDCSTYEEVCDFIGETTIDEEELKRLLPPDEIDYRKLKTITSALNEGWTPDWSDSEQKKWFPYFDTSSGFAFYDSYYCCSLPYAGASSRLCFKSKELAEYAGRQFTDLYKGFIL